jgi:hypothetical protein
LGTSLHALELGPRSSSADAVPPVSVRAATSAVVADIVRASLFVIIVSAPCVW